MANKPPTFTSPEPLLVNPATASAMLGMSVSTFYANCSSGVIGPTGHKIGKKRLFSVRELDSWVNEYGCMPRVKYQQLIEAQGSR